MEITELTDSVILNYIIELVTKDGSSAEACNDGSVEIIVDDHIGYIRVEEEDIL